MTELIMPTNSWLKFSVNPDDAIHRPSDCNLLAVSWQSVKDLQTKQKDKVNVKETHEQWENYMEGMK